MKKIVFIAPLLALCVPLIVSAHQHATFVIGGVEYEFVVGSLNEPIAVDDKTGVDFRVSMVGHEDMAANNHHAAGGAVEGLENTLKVELIAGDKKKIFDLDPVYNTPGSYSAKFYPTVATTLSYRFFGTINNTPVDLTFTCRAEGADAANEGEKDLGGGVVQKSKTGGFGCPAEKASLGFPEESSSLHVLADTTDTARAYGMTGLAVAAGVALLLFMRRKQ